MNNLEKKKVTVKKLNESKIALESAIRKIGFIDDIDISKDEVRALEIALDSIRDIENKLYDYIIFNN